MTARFLSGNDTVEYLALPQNDNSAPVVNVTFIPDTEPGNNTSLRTLRVGLRFKCPKPSLKNIWRPILTNPILSLIILLIDVGVCIWVGYYSIFIVSPKPVIDKSIRSFSIPNHEASLKSDALAVAIKDMIFHRNKRDVSNFDPQHAYDDYQSLKRRKRFAAPSVIEASHYQTQRKWQMELVYLAVGDGGDAGNIFTRDRLKTIHNVEQSIMNHSHFKEFCWKVPPSLQSDSSLADYDYCRPPSSLMSYFYPSKVDHKVYYDGLGPRLVPDIDKAVRRAMTEKTFYWFVDEKINSSYRKSSMLRSGVFFGVPLKGYPNKNYKREEQHKKYKDFVVTYVDQLSKSSTDKVMVLYGGNEIFDYEVEMTFWNDLLLALISLGCIFLLMFVLTSFSLWLTLTGVISILCCFPVAFFFYRVVFDVRALGILNGAAAFLIIGIGVDDVFVFVNIYRQSHEILEPSDRMLHTLKVAGRATFFTSFTTAAAFAANVASAIPALREFGLFMSLIVGSCWITVVMVMPAALNLWRLYFSHCESKIFKLCKSRSLEVRSEPTDVTTENDDDDVALLHLDDNELLSGVLSSDDDDDDPLLNLEVELTGEIDTDRSKQSREGCGLTLKIQKIMRKYIAQPVIKGRWIVLALFMVISGISIGLNSQLKVANKPPQLFRKDTNAQRWMELKNNLSADGILCETCSGLFKVGEDGTDISPPRSLSKPSGPGSADKSGQKVIQKPIPLSQNNPLRSVRQPHIDVTPTSKVEHAHTVSITSTSVKPLTRSSAIKTDRTEKPPYIDEEPETKPVSAITDQQIRSAATTPPKETSPTGRAIPNVRAYMPPEPGAVGDSYDPCANGKCSTVADRPVLEKGASVFVVFGLNGLDKANVSSEHVLSDKGKVIYDEKFEEALSLGDSGKSLTRMTDNLKILCILCKKIAANKELVKPNSAQCLPFQPSLENNKVAAVLRAIPECKNLPGLKYVNSRVVPIHAYARLNNNGNGLRWIAFSFESNVYKGQSYFSAYKQYLAWEDYITKLKETVIPKESPLQDIYQTSEFWIKVFMEVIATSSAVFSLALSMFICILAVALFTGHVLLWLTVVVTISGIVVLVVAIFYLFGWELGAVEAISLSILVGSSVDYCLHLVEGYLQSGNHLPEHLIVADNKKIRKWRAASAVDHVGVSIISSAITTVVAAIPLTQTKIQPFAKFGEIVLINTTVAIVYTLTVATAFLGLIGPAKYQRSIRKSILMFFVVGGCFGIIGGILYAVDKSVGIPGPGGSSLFHH